MTLAVAELYEALKSAGVDDRVARAAATAVIGREEAALYATKLDIADLKTLIAESKTELIRWIVGTMLTLTAAWVAIATLLRVFVK